MQHAWQTAMLQQIEDYLHAQSVVSALLVVGSTARSATDQWSDLDLIVVVDDAHVEDFFPSTAWLGQLGTIFACERHQHQHGGVLRVCFTDGRRVDAVVVTMSGFAVSTDLPLQDGAHVCFARSQVVEHTLAQRVAPPSFHPLAPEAFEQMVGRFWFKAVVALTKVVRNDLLIAVHLCLDVLQELCVLAMVLRDRAEGTAIHKTGGLGNDLVQRVPVIQYPLTAQHVLDCLDQAGSVFDQLAHEWSPTYQAHSPVFSALLAQARTTVLQSSGSSAQ